MCLWCVICGWGPHTEEDTKQGTEIVGEKKEAERERKRADQGDWMASRCVNGKQLVCREGIKICGIQNLWPNIPKSCRTMTREWTRMDRHSRTRKYTIVSCLISTAEFFQKPNMKELKTNEKSNHNPLWHALKWSVHEHEPSRTEIWLIKRCDTITEKETV